MQLKYTRDNFKNDNLEYNNSVVDNKIWNTEAVKFDGFNKSNQIVHKNKSQQFCRGK